MFVRAGRVLETTDPDPPAGLICVPTDPDLLKAWADRAGEPAAVPELLHDLDRLARPAGPARTRAETAFTWDQADSVTRAWVPQGITTSADAYPSGTAHGHEVVAVSWYSPLVLGHTEGVRVTFADVTDPGEVRYRHVLLVEPVHDAVNGEVGVRPVAAHAGGVAWYGDLLYVAATYDGMRVFDLADLVRVDSVSALGQTGRSGRHGHQRGAWSPGDPRGHRYLLPQRWAFRPPGEAADPMRFSFVSLDRTTTAPRLLAGEYGRGRVPTRIARFAADPATRLLGGTGSVAAPTESFGLGVRGMQGVARLGETYFVAASRGRHRRGDLWVGSPETGFRRHARALPRGPEDLSAWPGRGLVWGHTEWPGHRMVFSLRAADWPSR